MWVGYRKQGINQLNVGSTTICQRHFDVGYQNSLPCLSLSGHLLSFEPASSLKSVDLISVVFICSYFVQLGCLFSFVMLLYCTSSLQTTLEFCFICQVILFCNAGIAVLFHCYCMQICPYVWGVRLQACPFLQVTLTKLQLILMLTNSYFCSSGIQNFIMLAQCEGKHNMLLSQHQCCFVNHN